MGRLRATLRLTGINAEAPINILIFDHRLDDASIPGNNDEEK
jgi:hypothetical protein